jgi:hypothetical protein
MKFSFPRTIVHPEPDISTESFNNDSAMIFMPFFHSVHRREFSSFALMLIEYCLSCGCPPYSNIHAKAENPAVAGFHSHHVTIF